MDSFKVIKISLCNDDDDILELECFNESGLKLILRNTEEGSVVTVFEKKDIKKLIKILNNWLENNKLIDL